MTKDHPFRKNKPQRSKYAGANRTSKSYAYPVDSNEAPPFQANHHFQSTGNGPSNSSHNWRSSNSFSTSLNSNGQSPDRDTSLNLSAGIADSSNNSFNTSFVKGNRREQRDSGRFQSGDQRDGQFQSGRPRSGHYADGYHPGHQPKYGRQNSHGDQSTGYGGRSEGHYHRGTYREGHSNRENYNGGYYNREHNTHGPRREGGQYGRDRRTSYSSDTHHSETHRRSSYSQDSPPQPIANILPAGQQAYSQVASQGYNQIAGHLLTNPPFSQTTSQAYSHVASPAYSPAYSQVTSQATSQATTQATNSNQSIDQATTSQASKAPSPAPIYILKRETSPIDGGSAVAQMPLADSSQGKVSSGYDASNESAHNSSNASTQSYISDLGNTTGSSAAGLSATGSSATVSSTNSKSTSFKESTKEPLKEPVEKPLTQRFSYSSVVKNTFNTASYGIPQPKPVIVSPTDQTATVDTTRSGPADRKSNEVPAKAPAADKQSELSPKSGKSSKKDLKPTEKSAQQKSPQQSSPLSTQQQTQQPPPQQTQQKSTQSEKSPLDKVEPSDKQSAKQIVSDRKEQQKKEPAKSIRQDRKKSQAQESVKRLSAEKADEPKKDAAGQKDRARDAKHDRKEIEQAKPVVLAGKSSGSKFLNSRVLNRNSTLFAGPTCNRMFCSKKIITMSHIYLPHYTPYFVCAIHICPLSSSLL